MFRGICIMVVLWYALVMPAVICSEMPDHYSQKELRTLIRSAHSAEQYQQLSTYFHEEAERYTKLADSQQMEMRRELKQVTHAKYPSGYETALHFRDFYQQRAQQAVQQAAGYDHLVQSLKSEMP